MVKNKKLRNFVIKVGVAIFLTIVFCVGNLLINQRIETVQKNVEKVQIVTSTLEEQFKVMSRLIFELSTNLETIRKDAVIDIDKMLNGNVFVKGIFGLGSGTIVKSDSNGMYILTCYHVISDLAELKDSGIDLPATIGYVKDDLAGREQGMIVYAATIIKTDKENDLALLKTSIADDNLNVIKIAQTEPRQGDIVYSVGNPLGIMRTLSRGIIANHKEGFYFSDNTSTYGNSGGSLYNIDGELIGVPSNVMGYSIADGYAPETSLGLSIDLFRIKAFLEKEI
jgi:S1-C subfamily serine protease